MEEKKEIKISLTTLLLIIAIIVIAVMGFFMYKLYNEKNKESTELDSKTSNLENTKNISKDEKVEAEETEPQTTDLDEDNNSNSNYQENTNKVENQVTNKDTNQVTNNNSYIKNYAESISKELGNGNKLCVDIANNDQLLINNNGEAYISNNEQVIAKNVVNAWYFEQGQDTGSECILFLKKDGTITYMLYYLDESSSSLKLNTSEKTLENAKNIVDAVKISGNDSEGIGGLGFLLIQEDGTCVPYFNLEN